MDELDVNLVWNTLVNLGRSFLASLPYIVIGVIVILFFMLLARFAKRALRAAAGRTRLDNMLADLLARIASVAVIVLGIFVAAVIVFPTFKPGDLVAGLGLTSLAIGFAFKDILQNFLAGILILWRRPFHVGDQICTRQHEGTVQEINVRATLLETYDGERVVVPNADVYTNTILVRTAYDKRRMKFVVGIGYPDSIEVARATIHRVLGETEGVLDNPAPWVYVSELAPSSVNFTIYFWRTRNRQMSSRSAIASPPVSSSPSMKSVSTCRTRTALYCSMMPQESSMATFRARNIWPEREQKSARMRRPPTGRIKHSGGEPRSERVIKAAIRVF